MKRDTGKKSPIKVKPLNYPGQYEDKEIEIIQLKRFRNLSIFLVVLAVAVYELLHAYYGVPPQPILATILVLASGIYLYYADSRLRREAERKKKGSIGEKSVGDILDRLKMPGLRVFHGVVIPGKNYNIDHVILSRRGIFAVETKYVSKPKGNPKISSNGEAVFVDGKKLDQPHIVQAVNNANSLQSYLTVKAQSVKQTQSQFPVKPILVYPGWLVEPCTDSKIWVLNPNNVNDFINRELETISQTEYALAESWLSDIAR